MTDELPSDLARLREVLPAIVADMERHVPYASALAMRLAGTQVAVNHREQQVAETAPSQGVARAAFNGAYLEELALDTLAPDALAPAARAFAADVATRGETGSLHIGPGDPARDDLREH